LLFALLLLAVLAIVAAAGVGAFLRLVRARRSLQREREEGER